MGTYKLLSALWRHWQHPVNPIYRFDMRYAPPWRTLDVDRRVAQVIQAGVVLIGLILLLLLAKTLTNQAVITLLSDVLIQAVCLSGVGVLLIGLLVLTFLWPIAVALSASASIVRDREHRTLSVLLITPLNWNDLLTAKLAAALQWLNRPFEVLFWLQGILLFTVFVLVMGQMDRLAATTSPVLVMLIALLAGVQFMIARVQDYVMAGLIGLAASVFSTTRQNASIIALMGSLALVILRVLIAAVFMLQISITSPQAFLLLLATGPTSAIALALPTPLLIVLLLIALPAAREGIIRLGYRWVFARLGLDASVS